MQKTNKKMQRGLISKAQRGINMAGMSESSLLAKNIESFTMCFEYLRKGVSKNRIGNSLSK